MRFEHPEILWLLLILPAAMFAFFFWATRKKQKLLAQFISPRLLPTLTRGISPTRQKLRFALLILAAVFLIFTLAQPQHGFDLEEIEQRGLDIVVAIDTSKSMLTTDIAPNRLERAKLAALELMQDSKADRLGLVAFAGDAFLECPLTVDNTAFQQSVQALDVNSIPQGGTAIAAAINTSLAAFKEKDHYKALVLLTDGEDNDNEAAALEAAQNAAKEGLKIFTIGIGTAAGDLIRVTDANGNSDYVRDENGNVVKSHLNEALLQKIASVSGGFYLPLRGADVMDTLYDRGLAPLPKSEGIAKTVRRYHEQFHWPLAAAILLLIAEMLLPERKRERRQNKTAENVPPRLAKFSGASILILAAIFIFSQTTFASPASAMRDYQSGNFTNALTEFEKLAQVQTNDLRLVFNAGAAAYRATNFDLAQNLFSQVTLSPDLALQEKAFYNLGNTQYRQGELKFEPTDESLSAIEETWQQAMQSYAHAAQLDTNDLDAAANFAFVKNQIDLIAQLREAMSRAKLAADDAVRRSEFHRAFEIMESLAQNKATGTIATKKFQDYIKKLKDIDAIVTPNQK
jgi:Ca-activated chloride channel family protein